MGSRAVFVVVCMAVVALTDAKPAITIVGDAVQTYEVSSDTA